MSKSDDFVGDYIPSWGAAGVDYDAPWTIRSDGSRIGADRMRVAAHIAGWHQMRQLLPPAMWSVDACDAIVEATLRVVRDWVEAP